MLLRGGEGHKVALTDIFIYKQELRSSGEILSGRRQMNIN